MTREPYLSVVVTTRNDNHGGDPLVRTQAFVNNLILQCDRHEVPAELILVEWNPPADRPRMAEALEWPRQDGWCQVRIVEVPHELHSRLEHSARLPLFQMIGKNVGIRRARGEYVLATNIDLIFSDELMQFLAARNLDLSLVYRLDRWDIAEGLDPWWPVDEQLRFCERSLIRVNRREGTLDLETGDFYRIYHDVPWFARIPGMSAAMSVRFRMARYAVWRLYAFAYWIIAGLWPPTAVPGRVRRRLRSVLRTVDSTAGGDSGTASPVSPVRRLKLARDPARMAYLRFRKKLDMFWEGWAFEQARVRLHTNASGDFTLMSKDAWLATGGYAELEMYSMHIDGLLLYQAHYAGIRERYVQHRVYHMEHEGGFKPDSEGSQRLNDRLARDAIPQISNEQLMQWIYEMYVTKRPIAFNSGEWGFVDEHLPENVIYPAATQDSTPTTAGAATDQHTDMGDE